MTVPKSPALSSEAMLRIQTLSQSMQAVVAGSSLHVVEKLKTVGRVYHGRRIDSAANE